MRNWYQFLEDFRFSLHTLAHIQEFEGLNIFNEEFYQKFVKVDTKNENKSHDNSEKTWKFHDFEIGCPLSRNFFYNHYLVRTRKQKFVLTLKIKKMDLMKKQKMETYYKNEINTMITLDNPNIQKFYGYFIDKGCLCLMYEWCSGKEFKKIQEDYIFSEEQSSFYTFNLLNGLNYLIKNNISHRDIQVFSFFNF